MSLFSFLPAEGVQAKLFSLVQGAFVFYICVSFLLVASYVVRQLRGGRLLTSRNSPEPYIAPEWLWKILLAALLVILFFPLGFYAIVPAVAMVALANDPLAAAQIGADRFRPVRLFSWSLLICGAVIFIELPLTQYVEMIMVKLHVPHPDQVSVETFRQYRHWSDILGFVFQAAVIAPIIEELFFRGFLFTFLKNHTSIVASVILSAGVFAFVHVNLGSVLQLWFLGMVLAIAYQHTGSLLLSIGIHACFNFMTALSLLLDRGNS